MTAAIDHASHTADQLATERNFESGRYYWSQSVRLRVGGLDRIQIKRLLVALVRTEAVIV